MKIDYQLIYFWEKQDYILSFFSELQVSVTQSENIHLD